MDTSNNRNENHIDNGMRFIEPSAHKLVVIPLILLVSRNVLIRQKPYLLFSDNGRTILPDLGTQP